MSPTPADYPADWELIEVLGEPTLTDPELPWFYNNLSFRIRIDADELRVSMQPADGGLEVEWRRDRHIAMALVWTDVKAVAIRRERGTETLEIERSHGRGSLSLQVSPRIEALIQ